MKPFPPSFFYPSRRGQQPICAKSLFLVITLLFFSASFLFGLKDSQCEASSSELRKEETAGQQLYEEEDDGLLTMSDSASSSSSAPTTAASLVVQSPDASSISWLYYGTWIIVLSSFTLSFSCIFLLYKRRHLYPIYALHVPLIIANELFVPFTVWSWSLNVITPDAPCWFNLLFWDSGLFPTTFTLIFSVIKLWLDARYHLEKLQQVSGPPSIRVVAPTLLPSPLPSGNNDGENETSMASAPTTEEEKRENIKRRSWVVEYYPLLTSPKLLVPLGLCLWLEAWGSAIARGVRVLPYWDESATKSGCADYQALDNNFDLVNYSVWDPVAVLLSIFLLRTVREGFSMKKRFMMACIVQFIGIAFYYLWATAAPYFAEASPSVQYTYFVLSGFSTSFCSLSLHLYTVFVPFSALRASYDNERIQAARTGGTTVETGQGDGKTGGGGGAGEGAVARKPFVQKREDVKKLLHGEESSQELLIDFQGYAASEFCAELMVFMMTLRKFKLLKTSREREKLSLHIIHTHINSGSTLEINISAKAKQILAKRVADGEGASADFWESTADEVCALLLPTLIRYGEKCANKKTNSGVLVHKAKRGASVIPTPREQSSGRN